MPNGFSCGVWISHFLCGNMHTPFLPCFDQTHIPRVCTHILPTHATMHALVRFLGLPPSLCALKVSASSTQDVEAKAAIPTCMGLCRGHTGVTM